jgi:8-oxo-dGTP pyrophosphatase MutT (NUDIX family)
MSRSFNNVKVIIVDKYDKYLVGRRYDTDIKYSTLGGTREEGENVYDVLFREFFEETSQVLFFDYKNNKFYLNDEDRNFPLELLAVKQVDKQIYFIFYVEENLSRYISKWKNQFISNQYELITNIILKLRKKYPNIRDWEWMKFIFKYKFDFDNKSFTNILKQKGLERNDIRKIIEVLKELSYYLEMDDLDLVSLNELQAHDGLYERDLVKIIRKIK